MKKWMWNLSMLFACFLLWTGLVGFAFHRSHSTFSQAPSQPNTNAPIEEINQAKRDGQFKVLIPDKTLISTAQVVAVEELRMKGSDSIQTVAPLIPRTGKQGDSKVLLVLIVVAVFGVGLLSLGLFLKK